MLDIYEKADSGEKSRGKVPVYDCSHNYLPSIEVEVCFSFPFCPFLRKRKKTKKPRLHLICHKLDLNCMPLEIVTVVCK